MNKSRKNERIETKETN